MNRRRKTKTTVTGAEPSKKTFAQRVAGALAGLVEDKRIGALRETPTTAEWVYVEASSKSEMLQFSGAGWEVVSYRAVTEEWDLRYLMKKSRQEASVELES